MEPVTTTSLSEDTKKYLTQVHDALWLKQIEIDALARRFEPATPGYGDKPVRDSGPPRLQRIHVYRRLDQALCFMRGFRYNPHWAHFDRDSCGNGLLLFEDGVSLLGTDVSQDRWGPYWNPQQARDREYDAPVNVSACIDAFFALFEQRQALSLFGSSAPLCCFVGQLFHDPGTRQQNFLGLRCLAPRDPNLRIPLHRFQRVCISFQSVTQGFGRIHSIAILERVPNTTEFRAFLLATGAMVQQTPHGPDSEGWKAQLEADLQTHWKATLQNRSSSVHGDHRIFDDSATLGAVVNVNDDPWNMACPSGHQEMLYRTGLLLETTDLYQLAPPPPWTEPKHPLRSLDILLQEIPGTRRFPPLEFGLEPEPEPEPMSSLSQKITRPRRPETTVPRAALVESDLRQTGRLTPRLWMRFVLLARFYPYVHLIPTTKIGNNKIPLTDKEVQAFQRAVLPQDDTLWKDQIDRVAKQVYKRTDYQKRQRRKKQRQKPSQAKVSEDKVLLLSESKETGPMEPEPDSDSGMIHLIEEDFEDDPLPAEANGKDLAGVVQRPPGKGGRRSSGGRPSDTGETSQPYLRTALTQEIRHLLAGPKTLLRGSDAIEARFLAVRTAIEYTLRQDPLYRTYGRVWSIEEALRVAKQWRQTILPDSTILWRLGVEALDLFYTESALENLWQHFTTSEAITLQRLAWQDGVATHAPEPGSLEFRKLAASHGGAAVLAPAVSSRDVWNPKKTSNRDRQRAKQKDFAHRNALLSKLKTIADNPQVGAKNLSKRTRQPTLMVVARGTAPPGKATNQAELQILGLAVVVSLIRDGMLSFVPPPELWDIHSIDPDLRTPLEDYFWDHLNDWQRTKLDGGPEADFYTSATQRWLGSFALLSWEWGGHPGMLRFFDWIDDTVQRLGAADGVSLQVIAEFPLIKDLVSAVIEAGPLMGTPTRAPRPTFTPTYPRVEPPPEEPEPEPEEKYEPLEFPPNIEVKTETEASEFDGSEKRLLSFIEELHGYPPGALAQRFQDLADTAVESQMSATDYLVLGRIRLQIDGINDPTRHRPDQSQLFAGWTRQTVGLTLTNSLHLNYYRGTESPEPEPEPEPEGDSQATQLASIEAIFDPPPRRKTEDSRAFHKHKTRSKKQGSGTRSPKSVLEWMRLPDGP